ncbi:hypothetical protein MJO28_000298, partial [Puccinia striiformis f. sp. tritici]
GIQESYEEWEEASSLVEASKAKAFSAQDEQDFTVVKSLLNQRYGPLLLILNFPFGTDSSIHASTAMPPSHKALNVHCDFRHAQPLSMNFSSQSSYIK